jgi:DNA-binding CsgD family transcriptional regulator
VKSLSSREIAILHLIAQGRSNKQIALSLSITPETVKSHVKNIFMKLDVEKRAQAVACAQILGLLRIAEAVHAPVPGGLIASELIVERIAVARPDAGACSVLPAHEAVRRTRV